MEPLWARVEISKTAESIAPYWRGKIGHLVAWKHDQWYTVLVEGKELMLDADRAEFKVVEGN